MPVEAVERAESVGAPPHRVCEVIVTDTIQNRGRFSQAYPPGLVVTFDWTADDGWLPLVGEEVEVIRTDGTVLRRQVAELKHHGPARSYLFAGLDRDDVPLGATVRWQASFRGPRRVDELGRIRLQEPSAISRTTVAKVQPPSSRP